MKDQLMVIDCGKSKRKICSAAVAVWTMNWFNDVSFHSPNPNYLNLFSFHRAPSTQLNPHSQWEKESIEWKKWWTDNRLILSLVYIFLYCSEWFRNGKLCSHICQPYKHYPGDVISICSIDSLRKFGLVKLTQQNGTKRNKTANIMDLHK